jgi:hypothetical protein
VNALAIGVRPDRVAVDDLVVALLLVVDQDADDAEGKVELCGDLGDGQDVVAEDGDCPPLDGQLRRQIYSRGGGDQRLDLQGIVSGTGTPAGHGIGTDPLPVGC